jgi:UDP-glucose:(heptosyl)LPS alpha-1,3-glucosyltransferase
MRIAFVHRQLNGGGTEADLRRMATGLASRGHAMHLFCAKAGIAVPGAEIHRVPIVRGGRFVRLVSFALLAPRVAARVPTDVLVGFGRIARQDIVRVGGGTHASYLARMTAAGLRRPHLGPYHRAILWLERRMFAADGHRQVVAVSRLVGDEVARDYRVPRERIGVLYNGVDLARFDPARRTLDGPAARAELGLGAEPLCVAIGSGFERKGFDLLLRLWEEGPPAAVLAIIGGDERLAYYRAWAARLGGRVRLLGPRPDVERWLAAADVLVAPSRQEAFGNVALEALAAGVPVVTSRRSGVAELIDGELAELLVDDPEALPAVGAAIARALARGPRGWEGPARRIAERHPWDDHLARLEGILDRVAHAR